MSKEITDLLFLTIETKEIPNFNEANYLSYHVNDTDLRALPYYAEYGEIDYVVLSYLDVNGSEISITCKKLQEQTEKETLIRLGESLAKVPGMKIAGYQAVTYVVPYLAKRYIINELPIPKALYFKDLKPWSQEVVDISTMWRGSSLTYSDIEEVHSAINSAGLITHDSNNEIIEHYYIYSIKEAEILLRILYPLFYISKAVIN